MSQSKFAFTLAITLALAACAGRSDEVVPGTDAGPAVDGGNLAIDPPAESITWPCRAGVDAHGDEYLEFNPKYLGDGTEATAYVVGEASGEGIFGWFTGTTVTVSKDAVSKWYRYYTIGAPGTEWVLTYARCVDRVGNNASCWSQYGGLAAANAGPFRWLSGGTSYACKGKIGAAGKPAVPHD